MQKVYYYYCVICVNGGVLCALDTERRGRTGYPRLLWTKPISQEARILSDRCVQQLYWVAGVWELLGPTFPRNATHS